MRISLIQSNLVWENPAENRKMFWQHIQLLESETDLILLPEMFSTGFSMHPNHLAEMDQGRSFEWMQKTASITDAAVCGSIMTKLEHNCYVNRLYFVKPDGTYAYYDKKHLFRMAGEHISYSEGKQHTLVEWKGWKIMPLICYDLRFPVWSRNTLQSSISHELNYDLLIYVANWPERRKHAWQRLLPARAIENQCYVAAVNRVGTDGNSISYSGNSAVYDFLGDQIGMDEEYSTATINVKLDKLALESYRTSFPAWMDADAFLLK